MAKYAVILVFLFLLCGCMDNQPVFGRYPSEGLASWYNPRRVASGERYHKKELTCAMRKRGFGKYYLVCNSENGRCLVVRHNDFGPSLRLFKKGRIIDLSRSAFSKIADLKEGVIPVKIGEFYPGEYN